MNMEANNQNESESFVFVATYLCSFLYLCWMILCAVLNKRSAESTRCCLINSDVKCAFDSSGERFEKRFLHIFVHLNEVLKFNLVLS